MSGQGGSKIKTERYTLPEDVEKFRRIAGVEPFTLDVAACLEAHHAPAWYCAPTRCTREDVAAGCIGANGLAFPWYGSVWCNPPFDALDEWVERAWHEAWASRVASSRSRTTIVMLVPADRTEQGWWQKFVEPHRDRPPMRRAVSLRTHFLPTRTRFGSPGAPTTRSKGSPKFGCALLVWRMGP